MYISTLFFYQCFFCHRRRMFQVSENFNSIFQAKNKFDNEFRVDDDFNEMSFLFSIECLNRIIIYIHHQLFCSLINFLLKDLCILINQSWNLQLQKKRRVINLFQSISKLSRLIIVHEIAVSMINCCDQNW